jgi:hypothetical protein
MEPTTARTAAPTTAPAKTTAPDAKGKTTAPAKTTARTAAKTTPKGKTPKGTNAKTAAKTTAAKGKAAPKTAPKTTGPRLTGPTPERIELARTVAKLRKSGTKWNEISVATGKSEPTLAKLRKDVRAGVFAKVSPVAKRTPKDAF